MKAYLMYRGRDFDLQGKLPANQDALVQDLELQLLFNAMAQGDEFLLAVARQAILAGTRTDLETIGYRQAILRDCLANPAVVKELYAIAVEAIARERKVHFGLYSKSPEMVLRRACEVLQMFVSLLRQLQQVSAEHRAQFASEGFAALFAAIDDELGEEYLASVQAHLRELELREGVLISAELGTGNKGTNYTLRKPGKAQGWGERIFGTKAEVYSITIAERDESGSRALWQLRDRGINLAANALGQAVDHILSFFNLLRAELAFYIGCLNLEEQLAQKGEPTCFPLPAGAGDRRHACRGLYDVSLALLLEDKVVGNDLAADGKGLAIVTGANQGGKSTFLRSIGQAQLMMQCGMFVGAESFCANLCDGLFTHYKREEDAAMKSGKLDEELGRMSEIVDQMRANSLVLLNESFAATNEREGSEIARQIVCALAEGRVKLFFVTHLYTFARSLCDKGMDSALFLRAERRAGGGRTFRIGEGEPLQTSYGEDLYEKIFHPAGAGDTGYRLRE
jgi:DNA mismatch repair ATPase MutS